MPTAASSVTTLFCVRNAPRAGAAGRRSRVRVAIVLGVAAAGLGVSAQDALAKKGPPKSEQLSSVAQYRESIPSSEGPTLPGSGPQTSTKLPEQVTREIEQQGGSDAPTLTRIATKSDLGAPTRRIAAVARVQIGLDKRSPGAKSGVEQVRPQRKHAVPHAIAASTGRIVASSGGGHLLGLVILVAIITLGGGVAAARRRSA